MVVAIAMVYQELIYGIGWNRILIETIGNKNISGVVNDMTRGEIAGLQMNYLHIWEAMKIIHLFHRPDLG